MKFLVPAWLEVEVDPNNKRLIMKKVYIDANDWDDWAEERIPKEIAKEINNYKLLAPKHLEWDWA